MTTTAHTPRREPDVRQVLVHPIVWPHLEAWLATRGITLARIPVEDDLPTYAMTLTRDDEANPADGTCTALLTDPEGAWRQCTEKPGHDGAHDDGDWEWIDEHPRAIPPAPASSGSPVGAREDGAQ